MVRSTATRGWIAYARWGSVVALGGGALMLLGAALAREAASVPLFVIGTLWVIAGVLGNRQWRRTAREVRLDDDQLSFVFPGGREVSVPARDVTAIRRERFDFNLWVPVRVLTLDSGSIRLAPRMSGLLDVLMELRRVSPDVRLP